MKGQKLAILRDKDVVIVPLQGDLDDVELESFEQNLMKETSKPDVNGLVLDVSSVETIDFFLATKLIHIVRMVGLMDVNTVLVGMKPLVALTLTDMKVSLPEVRTARNLERGIAALRVLQNDNKGA